MKDSLGDRIKTYYEDRTRYKLVRRMPVIMRLDGRAFHTFTKKFCTKPYDEHFIETLAFSVAHLMEDLMGAQVAYVQSDEVSILFKDYDRLSTDALFDYNIQKIVSTTASMLSVLFLKNFFVDMPLRRDLPTFDARVFNIPKEEVNNYFVWRQQDWIRNSVQMLGQANFTHKELHQKSIPEVHEMLYTKDINWAKLETHLKNGICVDKWGEIDKEIPVFTENRNYIGKFVEIEE